ELSKDRLSDDASHQEKLTAKYVLLDVMQAGMRLLHPIMPFISEEIWQSVKEQFPMEDEALIIADFPVADDELIDKDIADGMKFVQESITAIRNLRKQLNLSPALGVKIYVRTAEDAQNKLFEDYAGYFARLARVEEIHSGKDTEKPKPAVSAVVRNIEIFIPLAGLIDPEIEKARLMKQLERHEKELMSVQRKLNNPKFVENAKPEIVAREREREEENKIKVELVKAQIADFD
ncbi:MAG TPA: class I tRNA ligase family protein, partial [Candidatus Cloacimonetes bacterium]|nr:class I tRNA ligase family protein [Candidatus Cloacimonadota bacterium]